jgi:hypothetical protein
VTDAEKIRHLTTALLVAKKNLESGTYTEACKDIVASALATRG